VRRAESIKNSGKFVGNRKGNKEVKKKVTPPFKEVMVDIIYGKRISKNGDIFDNDAYFEIIKKTDYWYSSGEERIGQGRENAKTFLEENPDILEVVEAQVREHYFTPKEVKEEKANEEKVEESTELPLDSEE